jgi:hypothetical protein
VTDDSCRPSAVSETSLLFPDAEPGISEPGVDLNIRKGGEGKSRIGPFQSETQYFFSLYSCSARRMGMPPAANPPCTIGVREIHFETCNSAIEYHRIR